MKDLPDNPPEVMKKPQLEQALRDIGAQRYHNHHPFHKLLHTGKLNKSQVQAWALNRYCYQAAIPIKDLTLMARMENREMRRKWRERVEDHDGSQHSGGGIDRWLKLTGSLGLDEDYVVSLAGALPATRFAVQAYVHFVREMPLLDAIASSLTELFSPQIIAERVSGMLENYDFIEEDTLVYFRPRLTQARRDVDFALAYVLDHACTVDQQNAVCEALIFKCEVLWSQLDALYHAYVSPQMIPPGCFVPKQ